MTECIRNALRKRRSKEIVGPSPTSGTKFGFIVQQIGLGTSKPVISVQIRVEPPIQWAYRSADRIRSYELRDEGATPSGPTIFGYWRNSRRTRLKSERPSGVKVQILRGRPNFARVAEWHTQKT